jgi:hypothetical protein
MNLLNKRNKAILIGIGIVSILLVLVVIGVLCRNNPSGVKDGEEILQTKEPQSPSETHITPVTTEVPTTLEPLDMTEPQETEPLATTEPPVTTQPKETEPLATTEPPATTQPKETEPPVTQPVVTQPTEPDNTLRFPYEIAGTGLVIKRINSYDGLFFEDGTDREVTNIAAIVLTNTAQTPIEYANITLDRDGTKLHFKAAALDAGATVIVLEAEGRQFAEGEYAGCSAEFATMEAMELSQNLVRVTETESGSLLVENLTHEDIPCVRIFYKFYMHDMGVYVGGITYTAKVDGLKADSSQTITPSHYLSGYSKIVMIKTYDE